MIYMSSTLSSFSKLFAIRLVAGVLMIGFWDCAPHGLKQQQSYEKSVPIDTTQTFAISFVNQESRRSNFSHEDVSRKKSYLPIEKPKLMNASIELNSTTRQHSAEAPLAWFNLQLKFVQETPGFSPPVAARAFGYAGVTLYETVVPGMAAYQSLVGQLNGLTELPRIANGLKYHWPTVANSALAAITRLLFANASEANKAAIEALDLRFSNQFKATLAAEVFQRSTSHGRVIAQAIYTWSLSDRGHGAHMRNFSERHALVVGPGFWVPTPPRFQQPLQPDWGNNRPFALKAGSECRPSSHPPFSEQAGSEFYNEMLEVYHAVKNLTAEQKALAEFWADNPMQTATPAGHWIAILNQIIAQRQFNLEIAAEAYAKVGIAMADAFISCWRTKYEYNLVRPITCIRKIIDANWKPPVSTPPFPEYMSGHSVQSGAVAQVLTDMFGAVAFTDHTHDSRNLSPRSFSSFFAAAEEAAISRLYGGIHFRSAIDLGLEQGKCVGRKVSALKFKKDDAAENAASK